MSAGASGSRTDCATQVLEAGATLTRELSSLSFPYPVSHVYAPLQYAWPVHEDFCRRYASSPKRILLLGMNPGPYGMTQTGVPFGEVARVRDWLQLRGAIGRPAREHPKRPVLGWACTRSEVSGSRFWGGMASRFPTQGTSSASTSSQPTARSPSWRTLAAT